MNDFITLTSNSEFFKRNPHKQAGIEEKTTSLAFPYTIKGTKEDVLKMFSFMNNELEIELEAQAELELLELLAFDGLKGFTESIQLKILALVAKAKKHKAGNKDFIDIGVLTPNEIVILSDITGKNLIGYKRTLDISGIKHVLNRHPGVTDSDFLLIPFIVKNYDFVGSGLKPDTIVYKKNIGSQYFYVEEVRKGRKKLVLKTFYKNKKHSPG